MVSRRRFLAAATAGVVTVAGCSGSPTDTLSPVPEDTPTDPPTPGDGDRPTGTPREPRPVDVAGAWPQAGNDPGHGGVTDATGVPEAGEAYWTLRRVRSGAPVLDAGRLFHFGLAGTDESGPPTRTQTPPTGTAQPLDGRKALFCRDARDGRVLWTRPLDYRGRWPAVAGERVVAAGEGFVAAYRTGDGREVWRHDLGERVAAASTVVEGTLLVSTEFVRESGREPDVRAYRVSDGVRRWKRPSPRWQADLAAAGDAVLSLSPEFEVGTVVTARALADGGERWSHELDDNGIPGRPVVAGGTAYVAPDNGGVHAFDLADGTRRWHYDAETSNVVGLAASDETAYLVDDGRLRAVDAADGSERWSASPSGETEYAGTPAVGSDAVYLEEGGFPAAFVALSRSGGTERWSHGLPTETVGGDMVMSGLEAQPAVAAGGVYAYAVDGLYAFGPRPSG